MSKTVAFFSHTYRGGPFVVGSHHLSRELAARGHTVVHVSTPVSVAHLLRLANRTGWRRLRQALWTRRGEDDVWDVVPLTCLPIGRGGRAIRRLNDRLVWHSVRWKARHATAGPIDLALVDQPLFAGAARQLPAGTTLVYRPTDVHEGPRSRRGEEELLASCSAVAATSAAVLHSLPEPPGEIPTLVLENGVDFARFARVPPDWEARSGVVYVGAIDDRFDWDLLSQLAIRFGSTRFTIAGPVRWCPAALPANIELVGATSYELVPELLGRCRVGLLPLNGAVRNEGRSPMKYYEYLAAGLYVLGRRTQELQTRSDPGVELYESAPDAGDALERLLGRGRMNTDGQDAARHFSWTSRAEVLEGFLLDL